MREKEFRREREREREKERDKERKREKEISATHRDTSDQLFPFYTFAMKKEEERNEKMERRTKE